MYLISINKSGTIILHPDVVKLEPTLAKITEDELRAIIICYDYYGPYRQLNENERLRRAHAQVFKNTRKNFWDEPKIKEAVTAYMGCQYDERREQVKTYLAKIATINEAIRTSDSPTDIARYIKTNQELRNAVNVIEQELLMEEEKDANIIVQGKGKLSFLERIMRNQDKYKEVVARRESTRKPSPEQDEVK